MTRYILEALHAEHLNNPQKANKTFIDELKEDRHT